MSTNWISHRGLAERYTENSRNAFEEAMDAGFTELETDLRSTADGHLVLHHDSSLRRTTGQNARIEDLSLDQFQQVRYPDGQHGLIFPDFAERFREARWILDIKPESAATSLQQLRRWADATGNRDWLVRNARFLVWNRRTHQLLKQLFPDAVTLADEKECRRAGMSILCGLPFLGSILPARTYSLPPRFLGVDLYQPTFTRHYHNKDAHLLAYLPEAETDIARALEAGADEILINGRPPRL